VLVLGAIAACGGGGGGGASGGVVNFPALRGNTVPSGASQVTVGADANQWARIANTGDYIHSLVYGTGLINFNSYIQNFSSFRVGTSTAGPSLCEGGSGTISSRIVKASSADISMGDGIELVYNNCASGGFVFNGTVGAFISGLNASARTFAVTYTAQNFGSVGGTPSVNISGMNGTVINSFDPYSSSGWISYYYGSQTLGTYTGPGGQANYENGSYTVTNAVARLNSAGSRQFVSDVTSGAFALKLDSDSLSLITSSRSSGTVYVTRNTYGSKVRVSLSGGSAIVSLDATNDGTYEITNPSLGVPMF
jgi:hypothetical protein